LLTSTAALFSPAVKEACAKALPSTYIREAIGATETGFTGIALGGVAGRGESEHPGGPTVSTGPEVIVIDDDNRPVTAVGAVGRLARGGHVPIGYYNDPEKTAAMLIEIDGERYAVPGDWARVEEDNAFTLLGRGNTCVNTGGEKVYPEEVEAALKSHPQVYDAVVVGVPDDTLGQRVGALIQPRPGTSVDLAALDTHVRTQIAGYKVPRSVWLVDSIGRTVSGKADYGWAREYTSSHGPALVTR
jgi:3-oxocholest-4-en-26-oate---CoA ligase